MDMPTVETPAEAYLPRSAYSIARVAADGRAGGNETGLETAHGHLLAGVRERVDLLEQVQRKAALFDAADEALDDDIEGFELHLLGAVKKNRDNPKYRRYFRDGLRAVTQAEPRDEEPEIVARFLQMMAEDANDPEIGLIVSMWHSRVSASRAKVIVAEEALALADKALANVETQKLPALMAAWREEYKKLEGKLLIIYASEPKRVGRFFKPFRRNRKITKAPAIPAPSNTP